ncbi:unnamed protein product [Acanthoscelides obtectus]|uniref:Uncharacterized protein n=1 Tax=Acanthoscelides obtectus TaxID=200917 RepID=A0A9P0K3C0_ACAOB|nr:unnamed protein product [Acanthoscelides obtectus]CAK1634218.1 hypothetical protein AOBTE_LOCUS8670 [Acanthoscelides obtectus]
MEESSEVHSNDTSAISAPTQQPSVEAVNQNVKQASLPQVIEPEPEAEVVGNGNIEENSEYSQEDYDTDDVSPIFLPYYFAYCEFFQDRYF